MGRKPQDLTGRQFGLLTAMYPTEQRDKRGSVYWHCVCECGNTIDVPAAGLIHAHNRSCGCLKEQNQKAIADRRHLVDGTCVEVLEKRKKRRDNESGFRGVFRLKNSNRYRVDIGFKGKRYYVGLFDDYDEAVQARLKAENLIHTDKVMIAYSQKDGVLWVEDYGIGMNEKELSNYLFKTAKSGYQNMGKRTFEFPAIAKFGIGFASCLTKAD